MKYRFAHINKSNVVFLSLWVFPLLLFANNGSEYLESDLQPAKIERDSWEAATQDLNYEPTAEDLARIEEKREAPLKIDEAFWSLFFKGLMLVGIIALTFLLLRFLVGVQGIKKTNNRTFDPNQRIDTDTIAEQIHEYDLNALIHQAIGNRDYSLAVRLYYLLTIQTLSEKKWIKWKKDKTNKDYLREIHELDFKQQFRELTNIFERVWYGESTIDASVFSRIQRKFQQFIRSINQ